MTGSTITREDFNPGTFTYNEWGEAESYTTPNGPTYTYEYDAEGLRTKKTTLDGATRYYCDNAGRVIAEADGNNQVTAEIIWGNKPLARKVGSNYYYYLYNGHGDVIALTDESGNIVNSYDYDEWGNVTSETEQISNPIRYAGEYYDNESRLYYLRARYYDPVLGRFISKDSVEGDITNPLSLNLYTYCHNDPLNYWDPSGHWEAGDENLPIWAQTAILVYTGQYMNATDQAGRDRAHANAQAVRYLIHSGLYQSREDWGAKPSKRVLDPSNNYFDTIVFHHTERPQYESMNELQYSALSSRKFDDIGYHFVIGADGTIYEGRSMENKGAHVELSNTGKIGIALMGNFESEDSMLNSIKNTIQGARPSEPTVAQIESAERITKILNDAYNIQTIGGHGSFWNQTLCPGNKGSEMLKFLYKNLQ